VLVSYRQQRVAKCRRGDSVSRRGVMRVVEQEDGSPALGGIHYGLNCRVGEVLAASLS
jgi:hypothetical protein